MLLVPRLLLQPSPAAHPCIRPAAHLTWQPSLVEQLELKHQEPTALELVTAARQHQYNMMLMRQR